MQKHLFDRIVQYLRPYLDENRRPLVNQALYGSAVMPLIDWEGRVQAFTVRLIHRLEKFGQGALLC